MLASMPDGRLDAGQRGAVLTAKKVTSQYLTRRLLGFPTRPTEHRGLRNSLGERVEHALGPATSRERVCQKFEHRASCRHRARAKPRAADIAGDEHEPNR